MSFPNGTCTTFTNNGINYTSDCTWGIFLFIFPYRMLVIIAPTSNISTSETASVATFVSFITASIIILSSEKIIYTSSLNQLCNCIFQNYPFLFRMTIILMISALFGTVGLSMRICQWWYPKYFFVECFHQNTCLAFSERSICYIFD